MPAKRQYSPQEEEVYRILDGYSLRRRLLGALEKDQSIIRRRILEAAQNPGLSALPPHLRPGGFSWDQKKLQAQQQEIASMQRDQEKFYQLTGQLDPLERQVVRLRHEERKSWSALGIHMRMCERQAQRIHRSAIRKMAESAEKTNLLAD